MRLMGGAGRVLAQRSCHFRCRRGAPVCSSAFIPAILAILTHSPALLALRHL